MPDDDFDDLDQDAALDAYAQFTVTRTFGQEIQLPADTPPPSLPGLRYRWFRLATAPPWHEPGE